ncbi:MAG: hypothetical protein FOGNACKC_04362 [Anaerolineae bacterium]|nr:hypothetical protein [Anaerolineae bacterium]
MTPQPIDTAAWWPVQLESKPDFDAAMQRIYAWHRQEIIDRAPVRFVAHNAAFNVESTQHKSPEEWKRIWFDVEPRVEAFEKSIEGQIFHAETFPMFDPNLGPDIYAAFYGAELTYGEVTSWSHPIVKNWDDMEKLKLDMNGVYFKKIEELMICALERCAGKYLVGYTDLHPGEDCAMAWRGSQQLCMDLYDSPVEAKQLINIAFADFHRIFDHFDAILKAYKMPSMCWIGIPSFGKFHVPSCDFSAMISPQFFAEFSLPILQREVKPMTHNVYHVDGRGVARHLDYILSVPEISGIQWVQEPGDGQPIMQWVPLIKKVLAAGKSIIVDLQHSELEAFIDAMDSPKGIYLWISSNDEDEQLAIIRRLEKWS